MDGGREGGREGEREGGRVRAREKRERRERREREYTRRRVRTHAHAQASMHTHSLTHTQDLRTKPMEGPITLLSTLQATEFAVRTPIAWLLIISTYRTILKTVFHQLTTGGAKSQRDLAPEKAATSISLPIRRRRHEEAPIARVSGAPPPPADHFTREFACAVVFRATRDRHEDILSLPVYVNCVCQLICLHLCVNLCV